MARSSRSRLTRSPSVRGTHIAGRKVLTLILAGGKGERMGVLTQRRAKPVMPFGGTYRLIDFALSNCVHSGLADVWVIEEYELHSLNDHLRNGRPWDLDRTHGGLQVLPPTRRHGDGGVAEAAGNAHALFLHLPLIEEFEPDVVLILSADHVYTLDYSEVIRDHIRRGAELTMVTTALPPREDASRFGNVQVDAEGRITEFAYKPEQPLGGPVTTEVFVYDGPALIDTLTRLGQTDEAAERLGDFGEHLVPELVAGGKVYAWALDGYWRDLGLPQAYWQAHMDLLQGRSVALDDASWPILTSSIPRSPAYLRTGAKVEESLISYGTHIAGTVRRSVLAPGVQIEEGAVVEDSVLLRDVIVRKGAQVRYALIDDGATVGEAVQVSGRPDHLCIVGGGVNLNRGTVLGPGAAIEPGRRVRASSSI